MKEEGKKRNLMKRNKIYKEIEKLKEEMLKV